MNISTKILLKYFYISALMIVKTILADLNLPQTKAKTENC